MNKVTTRRKKKYYSDAEKQAIIDKFSSSSLSKSVFCKKEHVSKSALYRWQRELSQQNKILPTFIPVKTSTTMAPEVRLLQIKLTYGIEFFIPEGFSPSYVAKVIKELSHVND